ncbi:methyl-accepting chemotaxis protein [Rhizobium oryzicola]|uniref:HAMP domain-containing methyl-accepting chemotaxis protein n=1 Tax=Rhizobium oryzicola TaxID=1232668 RepID=A0ABT8SUX6_9HYPH|nr:HAMP domain-containing methyl-accepting chemotaxis protein [Rhizobium oryzicola]MDO1582222.1 HAMP domain-containing methyl-accepting chemotaxis protein [Rhizobium oryzicola]
MQNLNIKVALMSVLSVITVSIVVLVVSSFYGLSNVYSGTVYIGSTLAKRQMDVALIRTEFANLRLAVARVSIYKNDPIGVKAQANALTEQERNLNGLIQNFIDTANTGKGKDLMLAVQGAVNAYEMSAHKAADLWVAGRDAEGQAVIDKEVPAKVAAAGAAVEEMIKFITGRINQFMDANAETRDSVYTTVIAVSVISIALSLAGVAYVLRGVANPIRRLAAAMRRLADGDLKSDIPFAGRRNELGDMAAAVEVFRQASLSKIQLEDEAAATRESQIEQDREQARRAADEAQKLRVATQTLGEGLRRLAAGDVSFTLSDAFAPEYEDLRHDFNETVHQLSHTISEVLTIVHSMDSGTQEIASGANDLSKRTEQQAASLEETAAALDEITQNVSMASKRTDEARQVASRANANAENSVRVVGDAEEAMRRIEESSQQISNIIGVIDEIAFQTNLLALNAGVEAARAGEAGKGFAVVAQEVRELAQRSANAAKEIKGLIQNSSSEVENGVKLVRDTGSALKEIGTQVVQVNQLMEAITTSSREQSAGLAEVNTAVNHMDQTTQQNAAMVEQSTAASTALASEARRLRELVGRFKLPHDAGRGQGMVRRAA